MFISIFGHSVFSASVPSSKGPYMFPFSKSFLSLCLSFEKSSLLKISFSAQCILCQMQLFSLSQFGFSNAARRYSTESPKIECINIYIFIINGPCRSVRHFIISNNIVVIESLSSMRVVKDLTTILQSINSLMKGFVH